MRTLAICCLILSSATFATACLWDYDTLREERARFPNALELMTGKFIRHSTEFYEWRIQDRKKRLETEPDNLALYDDLAVAYDKTGNQSEAIATILKKEELKPGLYETAANLGTFYIHSGDFEAGLKHINRAIEINPDAHFGREIYQKLLVEYVLKYRTEEGISLPLYRQQSPESWTENSVYFDAERSTVVGFAGFVLEQRPQADAKTEQAELQRAIKGIQGMMRFGHYDSPILLEALGTLLLSDTVNRDADAKRLASRAFLRAAAVTKNASASEDYERLAEAALRGQTNAKGGSTQMTLDSMKARLKAEVKDAEKWFHDNIHSDEKTWIAEGKDVEAMFDSKYRNPPTHPFEPSPIPAGTAIVWMIVAVVGAALLFALFVRAFLRTNRREVT